MLSPTQVFPGSKQAWGEEGEPSQSTTVIGRISCPGKYLVTLFYLSIPPAPQLPTLKSESDEYDFTNQEPPADGFEVRFALPTDACAISEFVKLEYTSVQGGCGGNGGNGGGEPGSGDNGTKSIASSVNLGRIDDRDSAGMLYLHSQAVNEAAFQPSILQYVGTNAAQARIEIIRDSAGTPQQLVLPEGFVNIHPWTNGGQTSGFQVSFYPSLSLLVVPDPQTGLYPVPGSAPTAYVRYDNPDAPTVPLANATRLRVTRALPNAAPVVETFVSSPTGDNVALEQAGGLAKTVKTKIVSGADLTEKIELFAPATATVPDSVSWVVTRQFPFGTRTVEESRGTGSARIWTTYAYHEDAQNTSNYGRRRLLERSDGYWERYEYNAPEGQTVTWSPLDDAPSTETAATLLRRKQTSFATLPNSPYGAGHLATTVLSDGGQEVGRTYKFVAGADTTIQVGDQTNIPVRLTVEAQAALPGNAVAWHDASNVLTLHYRSAGGEGTSEHSLTASPNGQVDFRREYIEAYTSHRIHEEWTGVPNAQSTDIVEGRRIKKTYDTQNRLLIEETKDAASGLILESLTYADHDSQGRPLTVVHTDTSEETRAYSPCCGQLSSVTHCGITTTYGYDALGRREWEKVQAGSGGSLQTLSHTRFTYDSAGRVLTRFRIPTSGPEQLIERHIYDNAGTLLSTATPGSLATDATLTRVTTHGSTYDSGTGRTTRTVTLPGGATQITVTDRAGRTLTHTGTAVAPVRYEYGTATLADATQWGLPTTTPLPFTREIKLTAAGADTAELVTTYSDFLGRTIKTVHPGAPEVAARSFYDLAGRLVRQTDPDGVQTLYGFTPATATTGEVRLSAINLSDVTAGVPLIDLDGTDRITRQTSLVTTRTDAGATYTVQRETTEVWETDASATPTTVSITDTTPDGLRSWRTTHGLTTASLTTCNDTTGERTTTVTLPDNTSQVLVTVGGRQVSETRKNSAGTAVTFVAYGYDAHGRPNVVSALQASGSSLPAAGSSLVTTTTYYADDRPHTVTTPDPDTTRTGPGYNPQTTTYTYHLAGQVDTVTLPDATQTFTTYWPTGQVKRTWGSRTYPSEYAYDAQGRLKTLTTWQNFATSAGAAVTTWNYSPTRGWLINKRYTDATGPDYDYWPSGRLKTRDWARTLPSSATRLRTSYTYNNAGDLWTVTYNDSATALPTPSATQTYDRLGRSKTTTDAAGLLTQKYKNGILVEEDYTGTGIQSGRKITRTLEVDDSSLPHPRQNRLRRLSVTGFIGFPDLTYGYDTAGRLGTLTQGDRVATLDYKPLIGNHQSTAIAVSGTARAATTRTTDALGRIGRVDTTSGATLHTRRDYTYDDANQRTEVVHEDALRWTYGYDALGQVTSARKRSASSALLPGYDHDYAYDTIGNRVSATTNGRLATYAPDLRNQYVSRGVPPAFDVLGSAPLNVNVLVGGELPARDGLLFHRAIPVSNAAAPAFVSVDILAALPGTPDQVATETRSAFVARTPESYTHDLDGNLTQDGRWNYTWDAENRLVSLETRPDVVAQAPALSRQKLHFAYDTQGRRIRKETFSWNGSAWTPLTQTKFLYDGWNLLAEYNGFASNAVVRSHVWGLDLSGGEQGAGGVGGLLWTSTSTATYAPGWDANGNVIAWIDLANGTVTGRRDYGAFGEPLVATGNATTLPFAFSTKYRDGETDLYYYGFRYYNPSTGRWLSRDPIGEDGGVNLYGMVRNDTINDFDPYGLRNYKIGTEDLTITYTTNSGRWNSVPKTIWAMTQRKALLTGTLLFDGVYLPDAARFFHHYLENTGTPLDIDVSRLLRDSVEAKNTRNQEIIDMMWFVESLANGKHSVTSTATTAANQIPDWDSKNWGNALGGYLAWGKGKALVCNDQFLVQFEYHVDDRYDFERLPWGAMFHQMGLAMDFRSRGSVKMKIRWKRGEWPPRMEAE